MPSPKIRKPTLHLRSGYFIDNLKSVTGLGFEQIEERVRRNQYENHDRNPSLTAPAFETVRDYFRLHRSTAFEPNQKLSVAPWLLAAELEFPGSSSAFFHPLFDLLFGELESAVFWSARFSQIPASWIADAGNRGDIHMAQEWELANQSLKSRKHRSKPSNRLDTLSFVHLSMLRLPHPIIEMLFNGNGSNPNWTRKYSEASVEIEQLQSIRSMESLTAMLALMMESTEIGDIKKFNLAKQALRNLLPLIDTEPACARIKTKLKEFLVHKMNELSPREYNGFLHFGFGLPVSWKAMKLEQYLQKNPF